MADSSPFSSNGVILPSWANRLPTNWHWCRLSDVCSDVVDCPHSTPELASDGPYLMARTSDILTGIFQADQAQRVSEDTYRERVRRLVPRQGDLLYSREGTYFGISAEVPPDLKVCLGQRMVLLRPDGDQIHARFLRYWLNSSLMQAHVHGYRDGSVAERLNLPTIRNLPVCLPSVVEQERIAQILGSFDDRLELNRKMDETLEAMARALFKSWFVDFDPVRAKAEGRDPGLPAYMADLFPGSFEDSELGETPCGWRIERFGEVCERIFSGGTPSTAASDYWGGELPWLSSGETRATFITTTEKSITAKGVENSSTRLARAGTTVIASAGQGNTRGQTSFLMINTYINQSVVALVPNQTKTSDVHLFFDLERRYDEFRRVSDGHSSRGSLTTKLLAELVTVLPSLRVIDAFDSLAEPIVRKITSSLRESQTLAALRDTLLPKLISGELRTRTAEQLVEAAL